MKFPQTLLASILVITPAFSAQASSPVATGCEAKRQNIQEQIDYARKHNNPHRVSGLEKALSEVNSNCTEAGLRAERESNVREKEQKVEARRQELAEAKADGRSDKISKKERKLEEAQSELNEARTMLTK